MRIVGSRITGWELILDDTDPEPACVVEHAEFDEAIDAFAANRPELAMELDEFKCGEFCGTNGARPERARREGKRKRGSGARFRELMMLGRTNEECLRIVRAEFPESVATLSDAAWNRAQLRKKPTGFRPDGSKV